RPTVREGYLGSGSSPASSVSSSRTPAHPYAVAPTGATLRLTGVTAGYGSVTALRDVDLEVGPGEAVAVLGANGAGKSTLACVVSGLSRVQRGAVNLDGVDITQLRAHQRARIGIAHCQEGRRLFAGLTV